MTLAAAAQGTAITVAMDMTQGIVARFRTMSIARGAVLTGHVVGSMLQALFAVVVVVAVAMLLGYRPAGPLPDLIAALGVLMLIAFAFVWLSVALGLVARTVESASNLPMPLTLLPFLSSGFVPTDAMPGWLAAFATHQPFTPMTETVRGLLTGSLRRIGGPGARDRLVPGHRRTELLVGTQPVRAAPRMSGEAVARRACAGGASMSPPDHPSREEIR